MSNILAKILGKTGVGIAEKLSGIVDKFVHTKEEKAKFQKEMDEIWISAEADMQKNVTERWKVDLINGNTLTRSVRPIVLLFLIISTVLLVFVDSGSIKFEVSSEWIELLKVLLMVTVSAYFGGRSYEKVKNNG
jgi:hypothetical protein|nr:hypothetical protein [uncultured Mediterranean phage uvMED]|tara:strand:- start:3511 stop:3912 length:402 start_codon:yes stop_codon:yes gene_type:complete